MKLIGWGGNGIVFQAKHRNGKCFALKCIGSEYDENEVLIQSSLNHKNILKYFKIG